MLSFTNSPGQLFNCWGKLGGLIANVRSHQNTQFSEYINGIMPQLASESDIQALVGSSYINQLGAVEGACSLAQSVAQEYLNRLVYRSMQQYQQNLTQVNLDASVQYLIQQMLQQQATVLRMTVGAVAGPFNNIANSGGNGVVAGSLIRPIDGNPLENAFAEAITFLCTADSFIGGAQPFNEGFTVTGQGSEDDLFAFDWPLGSNSSTNLNAVDGDTSVGAGNLLANSNWLSWSAGAPVDWTINTGSNITQNTSFTFGSGSALQFAGDGVTQSQLSQAFNSGTGTTTTLAPLTCYGHSMWLRYATAQPSAGILRVDLCDGAGNTIRDQAGTLCSYSVDLTALTVGYTNYNGFFRTPLVLPAQGYTRYTLTTPISNNGALVLLAKGALCNPVQFYTQGPFLTLYSGSVPFRQESTSPFLLGDAAQLQITNSRGAAGTLNTFQVVFNRLVTPALSSSSEYILPSAISPTLSDSLIS